MTKKQKALAEIEALKKEYPDTECALIHSNTLQLLIATRLSAQFTDARVNMVTPALFERLPTIDDFINSSEEEIAEYIRTCGLFKTKARDIFAMCKKLKEEFNGIVPDNMEDLLSLPGVGRKTANLILGDVYGKPAVVTDTHFIRICGKLGLTNNKVPVKVEEDLRKLLPPEESSDFCHRIVLRGRAVCDARKPKCDICCMKSFCKYAQSMSK